jgi:WD40 repeat protein
VLGVAFSLDSETLISCGGDDTIRLWRVSDGALLQTLLGHVDDVNSVALSPDGYNLASGSSDKTIRLWRAHW